MSPIAIRVLVALASLHAISATGPLAAETMAVRARTIWTAAGPKIEDGVVLIENGKIVRVGRAAEIEIPEIAPVGKTQLIVTVNELASNALAFEVLP